MLLESDCIKLHDTTASYTTHDDMAKSNPDRLARGLERHPNMRGQFSAFWRTFSNKAPDDEFERLATASSEPHRAYHNLDHIADCFAQLSLSPEAPREPIELHAAIWFHDVIYKPFSATNEADSAAWAKESLESGGMAPMRAERVAKLILATQHPHEPVDADTYLLIDIDLSILGRGPDVYRQYEANIRREYRWVPGPLYRRKRVEILGRFLERTSIYSTDAFHERYEAPARENLRAAIASLQR